MSGVWAVGTSLFFAVKTILYVGRDDSRAEDKLVQWVKWMPRVLDLQHKGWSPDRRIIYISLMDNHRAVKELQEEFQRFRKV